MNFRNQLNHESPNCLKLNWAPEVRVAIQGRLIRIGHNIERDSQGFLRIVNKNYKLPWERRGQKFCEGESHFDLIQELEI